MEMALEEDEWHLFFLRLLRFHAIFFLFLEIVGCFYFV
jgi:hypothetical protein